MGWKKMRPLFKKPCIECGALTTASRCEQHAITKPVLYNKDYKRHAAYIRATATVCHLCGKEAIDGDPWTADHLDAGDPTSPLAAAHRSCNSRRGNKPL